MSVGEKRARDDVPDAAETLAAKKRIAEMAADAAAGGGGTMNGELSNGHL